MSRIYGAALALLRLVPGMPVCWAAPAWCWRPEAEIPPLAKNPFAGRHPMTSTTRALRDATKGNPRRLKRVLLSHRSCNSASTRDVGIGDVLNRLEYGARRCRVAARRPWRSAYRAPAA